MEFAAFKDIVCESPELVARLKRGGRQQTFPPLGQPLPGCVFVIPCEDGVMGRGADALHEAIGASAGGSELQGSMFSRLAVNQVEGKFARE